jgi:hypothetical protein
MSDCPGDQRGGYILEAPFISHQASSSALLLTLTEERELVEGDGLVAGAAAAGPAAQDGLQEQYRLRQR